MPWFKGSDKIYDSMWRMNGKGIPEELKEIKLKSPDLVISEAFYSQERKYET